MSRKKHPTDLAVALARIKALEAALRSYATHHYWMALTDDADAPRALLVAHGRHMVAGHGWEEAEAGFVAHEPGGEQ